MNKAIPYSNGNSGFTLMETLASITIILIISGCIYIAFSTSVKTILRARRTADTALMILMIDRFIRDETNNFHIPYWVDASSHSDAFRNYLWGSPYGRYIRQFELLKSRRGVTRGIRVMYSVDNTMAHTDVLFPSTPILENIR